MMKKLSPNGNAMKLVGGMNTPMAPIQKRSGKRLMVSGTTSMREVIQ